MSFTLTATIAFTFLGLVWKHNTLTDWAIKLGLAYLAYWGASIYF